MPRSSSNSFTFRPFSCRTGQTDVCVRGCKELPDRGIRGRQSSSWGTHDKLQRLLALDGHPDGNLLVTTDGERAHGVTRVTGAGLLAGQLLQHLCGRIRETPGGEGASPSVEAERAQADLIFRRRRTRKQGFITRKAGTVRRPDLRRLGETIARLASAAVEHQLLHAELPHGVVSLLVGLMNDENTEGTRSVSARASGDVPRRLRMRVLEDGGSSPRGRRPPVVRAGQVIAGFEAYSTQKHVQPRSSAVRTMVSAAREPWKGRTRRPSSESF